MGMRPHTHDLDIPEEGDVHRRRQIVAFIRRNLEFRIVGGSEHRPLIGRCGRYDRRFLARALHHELLRRRRFGHGEADLGAVGDGLTVGGVMQTHDDVRSGGHQLTGIPTTVVVRAGTGQVAEIEVLPQRRFARPELHLRAATSRVAIIWSGNSANPVLPGVGLPVSSRGTCTHS